MLSFIAFVFFASSVCIIKVEGNSNCTENLNVCEWLNECCVNIFRERKNNTSSQEMISCLRKKRDETIMEPGKLLKDLVEDYYKINVYEEDIQYGGFVQHSGIVMSNVGSMSTYSNVYSNLGYNPSWRDFERTFDNPLRVSLHKHFVCYNLTFL
ncbi:uncharacterized protein LOC111623313 isoform X4 [Centruroides sculpturatus]|uniref:uncharacterized protein LOC111623313 isoform X4 n=1 Tax=Centruroides sculpturatus TaxID=218467 RepID=UPI000C6E7005|nr:uncharacterized protein LOC111623313 isoform X4 [Centruroides sculpturatus]